MSVKLNITITLSMKELGKRSKEIQKILKPISKSPLGPFCQPRSQSSEFVIGTHDGSAPNSDYRTWFFSTTEPKLKAQYYERWLRTEDRTGEIWYLERAYLNIHRTDSADNKKKEFVCLHCDPSFTPDAESDTGLEKQRKQAPYKRLPHMHIGHPMPDAHISLHVGNEAKVHASVVTLFDVMRSAIKMIKEEILDEPERWDTNA